MNVIGEYQVPETSQSLDGEDRHWMDTMWEEYEIACPDHKFRTTIFSMDPLVIYLEDFITEAERTYLVEVAESEYTPSTISVDQHWDGRTSSSASIYDDPVAACVQARSALIQGRIPSDHMETLQVVRYKASEHYQAHYDWFETSNRRISTIFAYLACDSGDTGTGQCSGGSTHFPHLLERPTSWCHVIDCEAKLPGVSFRAIEGNAIFWSNVHANGTFHHGTFHAGMPIKDGRKVGLNIWTRENMWDDSPILD